MKWILLKSNNPADALALATVISKNDCYFGIVRRSNITQFFTGLEKVSISFYVPDDESELVTIEEIETDSWKKKCDIIASQLLLGSISDYSPYSGFEKHIEEIEKYFVSTNNCLLYLLPIPDQNLDLILIDQLVRLMEQQGVRSVSGGSFFYPCIKGTLDLRQTISFSVLCGIMPLISFVITTDRAIASICEAYNKKGFVISQGESMTIDGQILQDANQVLNYINLAIE